MSILIDNKTNIIVQGFTGKFGSFHAEEMIKYGTNIVDEDKKINYCWGRLYN